MINIALVSSKTSPVIESISIDWDKLSARLSVCEVGIKGGRGWLPAKIAPGPRNADRVEFVSALVLDVEARTEMIDGVKTIVGREPPSPAEMSAEVSAWGKACVLHTSFQHNTAHPRYRLVFRVSRSLLPGEVKISAHHLAHLLGLSECFDRNCAEPSRFFYEPRCAAEDLPLFVHQETPGESIDVDALLAEARHARESAKAAPKHQHTNSGADVIGEFNRATDIGMLLEANGYTSKGRNRWLSPTSASGMAGVRVLPDSSPPKIYSSHAEDPLSDGFGHDSFDVFRILRHGGDWSSAIKDAASLLGLNSQHGSTAGAKNETGGDSQAHEKFARYPRVNFDDARLSTSVDYLVKGILDRGVNAEVYGPSGDGKTFFTIDLMLHIACGMPWRGRRVRPALVVYVASEAGASILRRFVAWRQQTLGEAGEGRTPLVILTRGPNLLHEGDVGDLIAELRNICEEFRMPLGVVVFDTLSRSAPGGDENSSQDMTRIIHAGDRIRDETSAATLFVHHSGKDITRGGRGHSSLLAACDTVICVSDRVATLEKARDGVSGETFPFDLSVIDLGVDQDGDPITTCVLKAVASEGKQRDVKLTDSEKIAFAALKEAISGFGQPMPPTSAIPSGVRAVEIETWRSAFLRRYGEDKADESGKRAFLRAKTKLIGSQLVGASMPYVWILR